MRCKSVHLVIFKTQSTNDYLKISIHFALERNSFMTGQKVFASWHLISDQPSIKELPRSVVTGPWVPRTFCCLSSEKIPSIHPLEKGGFTCTHLTFLLFLRNKIYCCSVRKDVFITRSCAERCRERSELLYLYLLFITHLTPCLWN